MILIPAHLWRYAFYRAYLNLIGEASKYYLGWLWWLLEPIAMTSVFFVVFTYLRPNAMQDFSYFLIVGVTSWLWFANGVGNATACLHGARGIVSQIKLPKMLFPIIVVSAATFKQAFVFAIVLAVMGSIFGPNQHWLYLPALMVTQALFTLAAASTVAFLCCCVRDLRFIVTSGLTLMMFCSGIFFAIDAMPAQWQAYFRLNPMAVLIEQYRLILLYDGQPDLFWCVKTALGCALWLVAAKWCFERFDLTLTRRVIA